MSQYLDTTPGRRPLIVIVGHTDGGSGACPANFYVEISELISRASGRFFLHQENYAQDENWQRVRDAFQTVVVSLFEEPDGVGIKEIAISHNSVTVQLCKHFRHRVGRFLGVIMRQLAETYGRDLAVYVLSEDFDGEDLHRIRNGIGTQVQRFTSVPSGNNLTEALNELEFGPA